MKFLRGPSIFMRDRPSPADADGVARDDKRRRKLLAFEFVGRRLDHVENAINKIRVVSGGNDLAWRGLLLKVHFEDRVHQLVRRQAVAVELVRSKLGRGFFVDDLVRNDLPPGRCRLICRATSQTSVFRRSPRTARPPFVSP